MGVICLVKEQNGKSVGGGECAAPLWNHIPCDLVPWTDTMERRIAHEGQNAP